MDHERPCNSGGRVRWCPRTNPNWKVPARVQAASGWAIDFQTVASGGTAGLGWLGLTCGDPSYVSHGRWLAMGRSNH